MGHPGDLGGGFTVASLSDVHTTPPPLVWARDRPCLAPRAQSLVGQGPACAPLVLVSGNFPLFLWHSKFPLKLLGPAFKGHFDNLRLAFRAVATSSESRCLAHSSLRHFLLGKVVRDVNSILKEVLQWGPLLCNGGTASREARTRATLSCPSPPLTPSGNFSSERNLSLKM